MDLAAFKDELAALTGSATFDERTALRWARQASPAEVAKLLLAYQATQSYVSDLCAELTFVRREVGQTVRSRMQRHTQTGKPRTSARTSRT